MVCHCSAQCNEDIMTARIFACVETDECDFCGNEITCAGSKRLYVQRSLERVFQEVYERALLKRLHICHRCAVQAIDELVEHRGDIAATPRCGVNVKHPNMNYALDLSCTREEHQDGVHVVRDIDGRVVASGEAVRP